ncbi:hypothetical protein [Jidongwangia harbinensis]|uniref:hypothetical protein n=1 Tax=Jidongwangia harbinensis TaxID=2878561 RepID=UPI001CD95E2B|nr:hypothetical protein [Jidongwangia harbinensis]MCA2211434.1 hypothetical protein [Jidongwangia harbinensis]
MTQLLDREHIGAYAPPALERLGLLRDLTRGAGPGGELIVMATGRTVSEWSDAVIQDAPAIPV